MNYIKELEKLFESYNRQHTEVYNKMLFSLAQDIMKMLTDDELTKIYEKENELFGFLSSQREEEVLQRPDLIQKAIDIFAEYLTNKDLTFEDFQEMEINEVNNYISTFIKNKDQKTYEAILQLKKSLQ